MSNERPPSGSAMAVEVPWRVEYDPADHSKVSVSYHGRPVDGCEVEINLNGLPSATLRLRFPYVSVKPTKTEHAQTP